MVRRTLAAVEKSKDNINTYTVVDEERTDK